uniref:Uncharacterized protein n=1 Tax=Physcomitrium patens TaxID=3218 RepID=A0A2K1IY05_PHYPA|nr:hypothetical protein PHYPA_023979 [Physcomitrium patens]
MEYLLVIKEYFLYLKEVKIFYSILWIILKSLKLSLQKRWIINLLKVIIIEII